MKPGKSGKTQFNGLVVVALNKHNQLQFELKWTNDRSSSWPECWETRLSTTNTKQKWWQLLQISKISLLKKIN